MQVTIAAAAPAPAFNLTKLQQRLHATTPTAPACSSPASTRSSSARPPTTRPTAPASPPAATATRPDEQPDRPELRRLRARQRHGVQLRLQHAEDADRPRRSMPLQPKAHPRRDELGHLRRVRPHDRPTSASRPQPPTPGLQNITLYPYVNPPTEIIDGTNLPKRGTTPTATVTPRSADQADRRHADLEDHPQRRGHAPDPLPPVRRAGAQPGHLGQHHHPARRRASSAGRTPSGSARSRTPSSPCGRSCPQVPFEVPERDPAAEPDDAGRRRPTLFNNIDPHGNPTDADHQPARQLRLGVRLALPHPQPRRDGHDAAAVAGAAAGRAERPDQHAQRRRAPAAGPC